MDLFVRLWGLSQNSKENLAEEFGSSCHMETWFAVGVPLKRIEDIEASV